MGTKITKDKITKNKMAFIHKNLAAGRWQGRYFELGRLREVFCDMFFSQKTYHNVSPQSLQDYFLSFVILAQNKSIRVQPQ